MDIQLVGWMQIQDSLEAFYTTLVSLTVEFLIHNTTTPRNQRDLEMDLESAMHVDTELENSVLSIWIGLLICAREGFGRCLRGYSVD